MDSTELTAAKAALRRQVRETLRTLTPEWRSRSSAAICARLRELPEFRTAPAAVIYWPVGAEVDLRALLRESEKRWYLPRFREADGVYEPVRFRSESELVSGRFRIPEPGPEEAAAEAAELAGAVWLVPGIAFDSTGVRLGRGGGYYDRLLAAVRTAVIGVFFACQKLERIPAAAHDRRLDLAVTERSDYRFGGRESVSSVIVS